MEVAVSKWATIFLERRSFGFILLSEAHLSFTSWLQTSDYPEFNITTHEFLCLLSKSEDIFFKKGRHQGKYVIKIYGVVLKNTLVEKENTSKENIPKNTENKSIRVSVITKNYLNSIDANEVSTENVSNITDVSLLCNNYIELEDSNESDCQTKPNITMKSADININHNIRKGLKSLHFTLESPIKNNQYVPLVDVDNATCFQGAVVDTHLNDSSQIRSTKTSTSTIYSYFAKAEVKALNQNDSLEECNFEDKVSIKFRKQEKEHALFNYSIFSRYHNNTKQLTSRRLNSSFACLEDLLENNLPYPVNDNISRIMIWKNSSKPVTLTDKCMKAFLCTSFLPITVGSKAASHLEFTYKGDRLPQFQVLLKENKFSCVICGPFNNWLKTQFHQYSTKEYNFVGFRQVYEHYISKKHKEALKWFEKEQMDIPPVVKSQIPQQTNISEYVKVESTRHVTCHYVWQCEIVDAFCDDSFIRRKQPKTLFKELKKWLSCPNEDKHQNCIQYKYWKKNHSSELKELCELSSTSAQSVFIPGNHSIIINGCSITITGGIKSLNPPCLGKAISYGDHPYTCKNCYQQIPALSGLIKKRKESRYVNADRIGSVGFRTTYAKVSEKQKYVSSITKVTKQVTGDLYKMQRTILSRRSWEEKLSEACNSRDEELMVINLFSLFQETSNNVQYEVLKNLIGKLKSGNNHRYSSIIKDIASIHKNRLGSTNYSLMQSLFGLPGKTTCNKHTKSEKIVLGINPNILKKAEIAYEGQPVIDCTDEGRTLRFLTAVKQGAQIELIGCSWDADISKWKDCRQKIPRAGDEFPDDFSAIQSYVDNVVANNMLSKSTAFHNLAVMTGNLRKPHLYLVWPTPNKGYDSNNLLKIWDVVRYECFVTEDRILKRNPIMLMGHSSDSAGFQLSAAKQLMTPNDELMSQGVKYLSLGIGESDYASPYLGPLPATAYLDYDHEMRLFLKCLKYDTLELTFWPNSVIATISHLQELQSILLKKDIDCPFLANDLLFARYLDQNCDAAIRVFNVEVCSMLEKHVDGSDGTILYIHAVCFLMSPFVNPTSDPESMQRDVSAGINIFRLWKNLLTFKQLRLHAGKGAASDPCKRGHFITYGCFTTAELLFTAATNHLLGMFAHFKSLGPTASSPSGSGTKTTERIISEIQGKTNQIQSMDAQPTLGDILTKVSAIQFNQEAEERLVSLGAKKDSSTNRRRLSHKMKNIDQCDYIYPSTYNNFLENQKKAYSQGYEKAKELFEKYCPMGAEILKHKHCWTFYVKKNVIPQKSLFTGSVDAEYSLNMLLNIKSASFLYKKDNQIDLHNILENDSDSVISDCDSYDESPVDDFQDLDECESDKQSLKREWSVSHMVHGKLENVHIQTALKILLPREYVSRERSRRHIAACFLPGLNPIDQDHDVVQFEFVMIKLSNGINFGKVVSITESGKAVKSTSSSSPNGYFRAYLLEKKGNFVYSLKEPLTITKSLKVEHILCRVHMSYNDGSYKVLEEDQSKVLARIKRDNESKDFHIAKSLQQTMIPYEYGEVEDIINRKIDPKTHSYLYLAKFKDEVEPLWLPANSFMREVNYSSRRKKQITSEVKQYAIKDVTGNQYQTEHAKQKRKRKADLSMELVLSKLEVTKNLAKLGLKASDLKLFLFNKWITDKEIKAATILIKETSDVNGLQDPILKDFFQCIKNGIQIHHDGVNHWLFSCEKGAQVHVYDTLNNAPSYGTQTQLFACYRHLVKNSELKVVYPPIQLQNNFDDCGFFAIAFAVEYVLNELNSTTVFNQSLLRSHLIDCFKRGKITQFPKCSDIMGIKMKDRCELVLNENELK